MKTLSIDDMYSMYTNNDLQDIVNIKQYSNFDPNTRYTDMWQNDSYYGSDYHYTTLEYGRPLLITEIDEVFDEYHGSIWYSDKGKG